MMLLRIRPKAPTPLVLWGGLVPPGSQNGPVRKQTFSMYMSNQPCVTRTLVRANRDDKSQIEGGEHNMISTANCQKNWTEAVKTGESCKGLSIMTSPLLNSNH
jgi:hypothetical protein